MHLHLHTLSVTPAYDIQVSHYYGSGVIALISGSNSEVQLHIVSSFELQAQ